MQIVTDMSQILPPPYTVIDNDDGNDLPYPLDLPQMNHIEEEDQIREESEQDSDLSDLSDISDIS